MGELFGILITFQDVFKHLLKNTLKVEFKRRH